ncbi:MAG: hypothetical protein M9922_15760 [Microthrixaceae bacterium]|nr:hypothetical protein [Microthrixaceae bacterium]
MTPCRSASIERPIPKGTSAIRGWSESHRVRAQGGYLLVSVIAILGIVAVVSAALLGMTLTAMRISDSFRDNLDNTSAADSALEDVVHRLQRTATAAGQDCAGSTDLGGGHTNAYAETIDFPNGDSIEVIVDCETTVPFAPVRDITLVAYAGGSTAPNGKARIEITDEIGGLSRPGNELRICDWQLGQNIRAEVAAC